MTEEQSIIDEYLRPALDGLVDQLTESQQRKFNRIFPDGVRGDKVIQAMALCRRTLKKK